MKGCSNIMKKLLILFAVAIAIAACKPGAMNPAGKNITQPFAKGGLNDVVKEQAMKNYTPDPIVLDLVLLAGFVFDAMDRSEKLMLTYQNDTQKQIAILEDILHGKQAPVLFVAPRRINLSDQPQVKLWQDSLKHRIMDGLPVTGAELRIVLGMENKAVGRGIGNDCQFTGPYYHQFYDPPKPTSPADLFTSKKPSTQPGSEELAIHIQCIKGLYNNLPVTDPYGCPLGPFEFGKPLHVPTELKMAFRIAAQKLEIEPLMPDDMKTILTGLKDETFWGPYK